MKLEITRTVEPDGTWIRVLKNGYIVETFAENLNGLARAREVVRLILTPPNVEILYSEEVPDNAP